MSTEAKIGLAAAAVALLAVLWFAGGRHADDAVPVQKVAKGPKAAGSGASKSDKVKERLAQLRGERGPADARPPGAAGFPKKFPTRASGEPSDPAEGAAIGNGGSDADLDFESLREMALIDEDPDNRIAAIWLLASLEPEEPVLPVLTQALSDEDPEVRMAAIQALSEFSEETPIDSLQMALQDSDAEIRFEALSIAAEMTDERVQPLIQQALDDPDEDVRSLAEGLADLEETYADAPVTPAPTPEN